ncbi:hypothetical protein H7X87_00630 [Acetobacteraceae bacterium]|nr:hypothetical protein [Candidatus Parcubacteria bacterium]
MSKTTILLMAIVVVGAVGAAAYYSLRSGQEGTPEAEGSSSELPLFSVQEGTAQKEDEAAPFPTQAPTTTSPTPAPQTSPQSAVPAKKAVSLGDNAAYYRASGSSSDDLREFQHGLSFVPLPSGEYYLIWSSSGNPPQGSGEGGNWTHDIYYSRIDPASPRIRPATLISRPEAQEPASAAISSSGAILVTTEDGWNTSYEVSQRYALFNRTLEPVRSYPQTVMDGGHSGHVASAGGRFVVFFSEGWVDGGGVDDLGSGDDVYATIIASDGQIVQRVPVSVGNDARDWWPVVAGSQSAAALVWQRFVNGKESTDLYLSILDPKTGTIVKSQQKLASGVKYYTYNVSYVPAIDRFLIQGSYASGGGFAYLVDISGTVTASNTSLPAIVRESEPILKGTTAVQATSPSGLAVYNLSQNSITLARTIKDPYVWNYMGTGGIFVDSDTVYIVSLSSRGLLEKLFTIQ